MTTYRSPLIAFNQRGWDSSPEPFDDVLDAFERAGLGHVRIQSPRNGQFSAGGIVVNEAYEVSVFLYQHGGKELLLLIEAAIVNHYVARVLTRSSQQVDEPNSDEHVDDEPMIGRIYGPGGHEDVLHEFEISNRTTIPEPKVRSAKGAKRR